VKKGIPKLWGNFVIFRNLPKVSDHPLGENLLNLVTLPGGNVHHFVF
jgi:hypothetical protein